LNPKCDISWFQAFAFIFNLYRYNVAGLLQWVQAAACNVHRAGIYAARAKGVIEDRSAMMDRFRESWHDGTGTGNGTGAEGGGGGGGARGGGRGGEGDVEGGVVDGTTEKAREEARKAGRRKLQAVSAICGRPSKHPQWPNAEVAFSSDDEA
jgi:hypothetical protein